MNLESLNAQPDVPPAHTRAKASKQPGVLRSQVWLTVQTRQAHQLIYGREGSPARAPIIGLVGFAERLRIIWQAARDDDPWADWWLIRVHALIEAGAHHLQDRTTELEALLAGDPAMDITVAGSERPSRVPLQFANPYAYRGARLLAQFDTLVCLVLTARRVGLLDSEGSDQVIRGGGHRLRSTFTAVYDYRFTGASRESLACGDEKSDAARTAMGEVPDAIVRREQCAPIVPRKVRFPAAFAQHATLQAMVLPSTPGAVDAEKGGP